MARIMKIKVTKKVTAESFVISLIEKAIAEKRSVHIGSLQNVELKEVLNVLHKSERRKEERLKVKHCKKTGYWLYLSAFR